MQRYLGEQGHRSAVTDELVEKMYALVAISSFEWAHGRATSEELRTRLTSDFHLVLRNAEQLAPPVRDLAPPVVT